MNDVVKPVGRFLPPFFVGVLCAGPVLAQESGLLMDLGFTDESGQSASVSVPLAPVPLNGTCHDSTWQDAEFCGFDAFQATGVAEMNHDCFEDILDFRLLGRYWTLTGPNISGDLNADQVVNIFDLGIFVGTFATAACPGVPGGMLPDGCQGTAALSFQPDAIVQTRTMTPGLDSLWVILDGYTNASLFEIAVVTSPNIEIVYFGITTDLGGWGAWDPDQQHSYRAAVKVGETYFEGPPTTFGSIWFILTDTNPAWIKLEPLDFEYDLGERIRWCGLDADHSMDFHTILNAGINGPAPPGVSTCGNSLGNPCGGTAAPQIASGDDPSSALRLQSDPNPFSGRATIRFTIPESAPVTLTIHDVTGRRVRTLLRDTDRGSGPHAVEWDGVDEGGRPVSSGVYHCRLSTGTAAEVTRMVLLR